MHWRQQIDHCVPTANPRATMSLQLVPLATKLKLLVVKHTVSAKPRTLSVGRLVTKMRCNLTFKMIAAIALSRMRGLGRTMWLRTGLSMVTNCT